MKNQFSLNIKTPCQENFNQFSPTKDGGFCGSCQKEVIDFTKMNANQIIAYFQNKKTENTCGKFNTNQLNTYPLKRKRMSLFSGISLACLALFSFTSAKAQNSNTQVDITKNPKEIKSNLYQTNIKVNGTVIDETGLPLPGVNVILEGTSTGTSTGFDGNFKFPEKLKKGDILVFSYVGFESKKVTITNPKSSSTLQLNVNLGHDQHILMGKVAVKQVYKSKRK